MSHIIVFRISHITHNCIQICHIGSQMCDVWLHLSVSHKMSAFKCVTYDYFAKRSYHTYHTWAHSNVSHTIAMVRHTIPFKCVTYDEWLHSNVSHTMNECIQVCHIRWMNAFKCVTYDEWLHSNVSHTMNECIQMCHIRWMTAFKCVTYDRAIRSPDAFLDNTLTATHCNTLQHTATHCNTLQHTATHATHS